jgi:hypothetical protein
MNTQQNNQVDTERIAMNIVYQIGDVLMEKGLLSVEDRQSTNDLFIDFTKKLIDKAILQREIAINSFAVLKYMAATELAMKNNQVVGEKNDYYITLEQLEKLFRLQVHTD